MTAGNARHECIHEKPGAAGGGDPGRSLKARLEAGLIAEKQDG